MALANALSLPVAGSTGGRKGGYTVREATLYQKVNQDNRLRCDVCLWRCHVSPGHLGRCKVRLNRGGVLYTLTYGQVAAVHVDPVEKKPLFHFYPTSRVFSLGSWGCNYRCVQCQNWEIAYAEPAVDLSDRSPEWRIAGYGAVRGQFLPPEEAVAIAQRQGCAGICWTYNEPTVWFEYTLDCARLAKERGLYTAYVTNGYLTPEALDIIGPYLDAFRVDFKGFSDALYRRLAKIPKWRQLLEVTQRAKERWGMHVEVVTNLIPTLIDDAQLVAIAEWIGAHLGPETPWHVTAFHPDAMLRDVAATTPAALVRARDAGMAAGLHFVYTGNVVGTGGENTFCPRCGTQAIERIGYHTRLVAVAAGGRCARCGADLNIRGV